MAVVPWNPLLDTFDSLEKGLSNFLPAMDVYEEKDNVVVEATLAGIRPEDVDVNVHNDVLTLEGKREVSSEIEEKNYYRKEVRSGSFNRSVVLPAPVQADKAKANFKNGLLKIRLPKQSDGKSKRIKINVNNK
ncbi:MAG: Hsp20/alpha crystallin family protein [Candidatus Komeilibacteria bacterium]|jgi:HSP20 family protein|nr:Hsp20/alpha crystallin family protein [Candidatus Komeilibacteria bacterium]MBT4447572.1 Hsp20/alpha crystallin family protein [Candidatus Komeilibacteria bacterium]